MTAQVFLRVHLLRSRQTTLFLMFSRNHSSTLMVCKTRMRTRIAVVIAMAMSPLLGGFDAEFIKSNTVSPKCGGPCNHLEVRVKTKASPVQELIKKLLNMQ